jgi:hypothetical protein
MPKYLVNTEEYDRFSDGGTTPEIIISKTDNEAIRKGLGYSKKDWEEMIEDDFDGNEVELIQNCISCNGDGQDYVRIFKIKGTELTCIFE